VTLGEHGRILVKCFAGCDLQAIFGALGIAVADLFVGSAPAGLDPDAMYEYRDERGALLFQVVRGPGKRFRQRRPDGRGGWTWNLAGVRRVLYRLPELCAADPSAEVYVVEGEKDVETLRRLGIIATTNPQGAGKWRPELSEPLRGRDVVILPDNDEPGRKHADSVARLLAGVARRIRVVELPGLQTKEDVTDWTAAGNTIEHLRELVAAAPTSGAAPIGPAATVVTLADVEPERVEWLWAGRIPRGKLTLLDGDPGLGKSTVAYDIAARVTRGLPMPGETAGAAVADVVILSHEDGLADTIRPRLEAADADLRRVHAIQAVPTSSGGARLPVLPEDLREIVAVVDARAAKLLVIDPLFAYLASEVDSFRDHDVRAALAPLAAAAERSRLSILVIRHLNKRAGGPAIYRGGGSIGIIGLARSGLVVASDPDDPAQRILASVKNNLGPPAPSLRWQLVGNSAGVARVEWLGTSEHNADALLSDPADMTDERSALREACDFLRELLGSGEQSAADVFKRGREAGVSERTMERAKRRLGVRHRKQFGSGRFVWYLPEPAPIAASEESATAAVAELAEMNEPGATTGRLNGSPHEKGG
jgi:5S rRNA maturation endonuclease (ribonuclease M5)